MSKNTRLDMSLQNLRETLLSAESQAARLAKVDVSEGFTVISSRTSRLVREALEAVAYMERIVQRSQQDEAQP
jgi:hypothetical protein